MDLIPIARVEDFEREWIRSYRVMARPVAVIRERDGSFRAMEIGCKHENADLTKGHFKGTVVTCPWHGWKYDLATGECLWGSTTCLRPYACEVREGRISMLPLDKDGPSPDLAEW